MRFRTLFEECPVSLWEEDYSATRRAVEALRACGVADLRAYLEARPDEVQRLMALARVVDVNRATLALFEADSKEACADPGPCFTPESLPAIRQSLLALAGGATRCEVEAPLRTLRGRPLRVIVHWVVAPGHEPQWDRVIVSMVDVTAARDAQQVEGERRDAVELAERLVSASVAGILAYHEDGRCVVANEAAARMIGTTVDGMLAQNFRELASWRRSGLLELAEATLETGQPRVRELHFVTTFKREVWLEICLARFTLHGQRHVLLSIQDCTERRRAELALRKSEERLRLALAVTGDGLFDWDLAAGTLHLNPAARDLLGCAAGEIPSWRSLLRRVHPAHRREVRQLFEGYRAGARVGHELELRLRDHRWILSRGKVIERDDEGRPRRVLGTHRDVTDRRQVEDARQALLEREHAARLLAERAVQARDEFISVAAHEFRTPLTSLRLGLQASLRQSQRGAWTTDLVRTLEVAERQTRRLGKLLDNLLDVARLHTGNFSVEREPTDLAAAARAVVESLADEAALVGSPVELAAPAPLEVRADRARVEQALTNLVGNALRYGGGRPIVVTVERDGSWARVGVRDHGPGIAAADLPRIFDRFARASSTRHFGGLGLGLYIARHVAECHGGRITVDSREGEGSCFSLELPVR